MKSRIVGWAAIVGYVLVASSLAAADEGGTLQKIKASGQITIGIRETSSPHSFFDANKRPSGYMVDLCAKVVDELKGAVAMPTIKVNYVGVTPANRQDKVSDGSVDMECGTTTVTLKRRRYVDFSFVTFVDATRLLVRKDSGIKSTRDLKGKKVAVIKASTFEETATRLNGKESLGMVIVRVTEVDDVLKLVDKGEVSAGLMQESVAAGMITKAGKDDSLTLVGEYLTYEPLAIMLRRNDAAFHQVVDRALAKLFKSGEINAIYDKWFKSIHLPMNEQLKNAVQLQSFPD